VVLERDAAALKQKTTADGQVADAVAMLREAAKLRRAVTGMESREEARRELASSLVALGNAELDHAALSEAMAAYQEALTIFREMLQREPDRPEWQHDLSICLNRVGDVRKARGALDEALSAYQESLAIRRRLVQREPERPSLRPRRRARRRCTRANRLRPRPAAPA
jgi:tetratricopeptide (TPR) repeat protein